MSKVQSRPLRLVNNGVSAVLSSSCHKALSPIGENGFVIITETIDGEFWMQPLSYPGMRDVVQIRFYGMKSGPPRIAGGSIPKGEFILEWSGSAGAYKLVPVKEKE